MFFVHILLIELFWVLKLFPQKYFERLFLHISLKAFTLLLITEVALIIVMLTLVLMWVYNFWDIGTIIILTIYPPTWCHSSFHGALHVLHYFSQTSQTTYIKHRQLTVFCCLQHVKNVLLTHSVWLKWKSQCVHTEEKYDVNMWVECQKRNEGQCQHM